MAGIKDKKKVTIIILALVVLVLLLVGVYFFWLKPSLNGLVVLGRNQGYSFAVASLIEQASTCQPVPIFFGNQTIDMIAVECLPAECFK